MSKSSECRQCGEPLYFEKGTKSFECPRGCFEKNQDDEAAWLDSRLEDDGDYLDRSYGPERF